MSTIITKDYIDLIKLQRPYVIGNTDQEIFDCYMQDIAQDYDDIKEFLSQTKNLVDLGAGMGGIDFLIKQHRPEINISLLDGQQVESGTWYGYHNDLKFYSNNGIAQQFFEANGTSVDFYPASDDLIVKCDTLISLNSWGFHYPINRYINFVNNNRPSTIILDVRIGKQKLNELEDLGYEIYGILRTWQGRKARTVLFDPLTHVSPTTT